MDDHNSSTSGATEATAPSARAHHAGDGGAVAGGLRRFSVKRKLAIVGRLLRGEGLEGLCCANAEGDSSCESSVVAGMHEQTYTPDLQDQELAGL